MQGIGKKKLTILKIAGSAAQLFWPASCAACGRLIEADNNGLCDKCWQDLRACCGGDYCPRCGLAASAFAIHNGACSQCRDQQFFFDAIARAGIYTGALSKVILAFKHGRDEVGPILKTLITAAMDCARFELPIDQFVPVPLHWVRRIRRGFNQSQILAQVVCAHASAIKPDLARIRNTQRQALLDLKQRSANVRDAFALRAGHNFKDKVVCLVDDVKTTGSTLNECARLIKVGGAKKVYALVIAAADPNFRNS